AGDPERAREHYDEAMHADDELLPATRAMRRLLGRLGRFQESLRPPDPEIELSGARERAAPAAFRAAPLLPVGGPRPGGGALGAPTDARPDDVRSLLAQMELAYSDERDDELLEALAAAARHVNDARLRAALAVLRGRVLEGQGRDEDAGRAYADALAADGG